MASFSFWLRISLIIRISIKHLCGLFFGVLVSAPRLWEAFTTLCQEQLTPEKFKTAEDMSAFTSALHDISEKCIPKSSTRSKRRNPWYNDDCKTAINKRKSALRKFNKNPSRENDMHSKLARA